MSWDEMTDKDKTRLVLQHVMNCFVLDATATGWRTPEIPRGTSAPAGFDWPIAFWNTDADCWMTRDIATDPDFFDPLHSLNDAWLIMDKIKPGRAKGEPIDQKAFLIRSRFVDKLDNGLPLWSMTREQACDAICRYALYAVGKLEE